MGDLPRLTGMDFDRLRHIELNPDARAAEYGLNGAEGRRLQGERFSMGRSLQEPAEPLGAVAVEAPLAERRRREDGIEVGIECIDRRVRKTVRDEERESGREAWRERG